MVDTKEQELIDAILPEESQGFLVDYFLNGLFGESKNFTNGLAYQDYDIILSTDEAEDEEIFRSLNICNTRFDPRTPPSRKVIQFEDLEAVVQPFIDGRVLAEKDFRDVTLHIYPKIRRNLRFDIASLTYKVVKNEGGIQKLEDYKMEHVNDNPDKKDILCICSFKLNGKSHKFEKILQLLEQFNEFEEFWNYHRISYIIFGVKEEKDILEEFKKFPDQMKDVNERFTNVRLLFYINPPGEDDEEILNMYAFNDLGKNYYFHMTADHVIYRADDMLCSGDIIENSIKRKKQELVEQSANLMLGKTKEQIIKERNETFLAFFNFLKNIKDYKYVLYIGFKFEVCLGYDEDFNLTVKYIDFAHLIGELRTKEFKFIKKCTEVFKPDHVDIEEIYTVDIDIDFSDKECYRCSKQIPDNQDMYYCYKCKIKWCRECVWKNFWMNKGKAKFIDSKHNVLYFKTRDASQFKNIDKHKLGKDLFSQCVNDSKLVQHNAICNGCKESFDYNSPRYICLHCRPGKVISDGYYDYCDTCVQEMMNNTEKGKKMQELEEKLYSEETRILYNAKETYRHENDNHVYLMITQQYNRNEQTYYDF